MAKTRPAWCDDPTIPIPSEFAEAERAWGPRIREGRPGRHLVMRDTGFGCTRTHWLYALAKGKTAHAPPSMLPGAQVRQGPTLADAPEDHAETVDDLLDRRIKAHDRKRQKWQARQHYTIRIPDAGPVAVTHFGDPHLDDDGCDLRRLRDDVDRVSGSGMPWYATNLGDTTNNWVGRLMRLWAHQTSTSDEAARLSEWFAGSTPWLAFVLGNHDLWNEAMAALRRLKSLAGSDILIMDDVCRMTVEFPEGEAFRLEMRHNFKGTSIYNPTHGPLRASLFDGWPAELYIQGHHHEWAILSRERWDGTPVHACKVRGYKMMDSYARSHQYHEHQHGHCMTVIHDPTHPDPMHRARVVWGTEEAEDVLRWTRKRRGYDDPE